MREVAAVVGLRSSQTAYHHLKKLEEEGNMVRLGPENGDHEELVLPPEDVRVQGRVVHRPGKKAAGGGT